MSRTRKLLLAARAGRQIRYDDLIALTEAFGFVRSMARKRGSHDCKYSYPGWDGLLLFQQGSGGQAMKYQVRQLLKAVDKLDLHLDRE